MKQYLANYTDFKTGNSESATFNANSLKEARTLAQNYKRHSSLHRRYNTNVFRKK